MAEFVGADTQQLRDLARTFKQDGTRLTAAAKEVSGQLQSSRWLGADADAFRARWNGALKTRLTAAGDALLKAGSEVLRNAVEQDLASETFDSAAYGTLLQGESWSDIINGVQDLFQGDIPASDLGGKITVSDPASLPVDGAAAQQQFANLANVNQGSIGDCWLISALAAVGHSDPQWIDDHINFVNGHWEVTLYEDGKPVTVTVQPDSLVAQGARGSGESITWMSIYEQAVQQHLAGGKDDYSVLVADSTTRGFELITGNSGSESILPPSIQDMDAALANNQPITGMTDPLHPWRSDLSAAHVYIVSDVDVEAGTVTVVNPWGPGPYAGDYAQYGDTITMSYADYRANFIMTGVGGKTS